MLQRRLTIAKKVVRCSSCLPSTLEWYRSLATVMQRVLENVPQVQDPDSPEYETQHSIVAMLQHAEPQLVEAAEDVISRSVNIPSGLCGWCGERWGPTCRAAEVAAIGQNVSVVHTCMCGEVTHFLYCCVFFAVNTKLWNMGGRNCCCCHRSSGYDCSVTLP